MSNKIKPASTGLTLYRYYKGYLEDILSANRRVAEQKIKEACNITCEKPLSLQDKVQKLCEFSSGNKFWDWFLHRKIAKAVAHLFDMSTPEELETIKEITDKKTQEICMPILQDREYKLQKRAEQLLGYFQDLATSGKTERGTLRELQIAYSQKATSPHISQHSIPKWYAVLHMDTSKESEDKEGNLVLTSLSDKPPTELQPDEYVAVFGSEIDAFLQKATLFQITKKARFGKKTILEKRILWNTSCETVAKEFAKIEQEPEVQSVTTETVHILPKNQFQKLLLYRAMPNEMYEKQISEHKKTEELMQRCQTLLDERTALTQQKQIKEAENKAIQSRAHQLTANMVEQYANFSRYRTLMENMQERTEHLNTDQGLKTVPEIEMLQVQTQKIIEQQEDLLLQIQALDMLLQRLDSQDVQFAVQEITKEHLRAVQEFTTTDPAKQPEMERKIQILLKQIKYLQKHKTQQSQKIKKFIAKDLKKLIHKEKKEKILTQLSEEIQKNKERLHQYTELLKSAPVIIEQQKQQANVKQFIELYVNPKFESFSALVTESEALNKQRCELEMQLKRINDAMKKNAASLATMPSIEELQQDMESLDNIYSQKYMELEYQAIQDLTFQQKIAQVVLASPKL